jgi:RNA polymerase sigma-70 factor (ECF subfamily)
VDERARAIEAIYRRRYTRFYDVLSSLTGSRELGHDAVQETFAQALRARHGFRSEGTLEAWIWRIAVRTAGRQRIEHRVQDAPPEAAGNGQSSPAAPWSDRDPELAEAVRLLTPRQRLMVFLHYFADLSYAQIADICAVREGTVAATLSQARSALHDTLGAKEYQR